jgi:hypothetical protein
LSTIAITAVAAALLAACGNSSGNLAEPHSGSTVSAIAQQSNNTSGIPLVCHDEGTISTLVGFAFVGWVMTAHTSTR